MEPRRQSQFYAPRYERHCPETMLLYQVVERHYPDFLAELAAHSS